MNPNLHTSTFIQPQFVPNFFGYYDLSLRRYSHSKLRQRFGLSRIVLVGDRGLLTHLKSLAIRNLVDSGCLQRSLFDQQNLAEIRSPDFPDERLVACFNPLLAAERGRKRQELLAATEKELDKIAKEVARRSRKPIGQA